MSTCGRWGLCGLVVFGAGAAIHFSPHWPGTLVPLLFIAAAIGIGLSARRRSVPAAISAMMCAVATGALAAFFPVGQEGITFDWSHITAPVFAAMGVICCLGVMLTTDA